MNISTCYKCSCDFEDDDILWATPTGELEGDTKPYCVMCAPEQPNYEGAICGDCLYPVSQCGHLEVLRHKEKVK